MGTKLNPDSVKIKALRIQKGWTQEQLAEIAGISPRTIQRAETANCAAFETVRAIAVAFETDFDQLIKSESPDVPSLDPESAPSGPEFSAIVGMGEPATLAQPAPTFRRTWITLGISAFALAAGLVAGIGLTSRPDRTSELHFPPPALLATPVQQVQVSPEASQQAAAPKEPAVAPKAVQRHAPADVIPDRDHRAVESSLGNSNPIEQVAKVSVAAEAPSQEPVLLSRQTASPDLPLQLPVKSSALAIPEVPVASNSGSGPSVDSADDEQGPGAVRRAVDVAARKSGSFLSKAGASLKRAF